MSKMYLVETVSIFRHRYVVEAKEKQHALDEVVCSIGGVVDDWQEFSQQHVDECITSSREIDREEYLRLFAEDNAYLSSWEEEMKFKFVNKIVYEG
jgi:hypothetical protein